MVSLRNVDDQISSIEKHDDIICKSSSKNSKSVVASIKNTESKTKGPDHLRQKLPRPSSTKLDRIFNFNFPMSSEIKAQNKDNKANRDIKKNNVNRFGFKNPYQQIKISSKNKLLSSQGRNHEDSNRNKSFSHGNTGLNMNFNEFSPVKSSCLVSAQLRRNPIKTSCYKCSSTNKIASSSPSGSKNSRSSIRRSSSKSYERYVKSSAKEDIRHDNNSVSNDKKQTKITKSECKVGSYRRHSTPEYKLKRMSERNVDFHEEHPVLSEGLPDQLVSKICTANNNSSIQHIVSCAKVTEAKTLVTVDKISGDFGVDNKTDLSVPDLEENGSNFSLNSRNLSTCSLMSGDNHVTDKK